MATATGIRKSFYLDTVERLKLIVDDNDQPVIKTIDLWNEQWQFIDKIPAFAFPAVFIGFKQMTWTQLGKHRQSADALIEIHVGSYSLAETKNGSVNQEKALAHLDLLDAIHYWLSGWDKCGDYFGGMTRVNSEFDHNHNATVAHVETYKVRMIDDSAVRLFSVVQGDLLKLTLVR
jgi:hypothetical protein